MSTVLNLKSKCPVRDRAFAYCCIVLRSISADLFVGDIVGQRIVRACQRFIGAQASPSSSSCRRANNTR